MFTHSSAFNLVNFVSYWIQSIGRNFKIVLPIAIIYWAGEVIQKSVPRKVGSIFFFKLFDKLVYRNTMFKVTVCFNMSSMLMEKPTWGCATNMGSIISHVHINDFGKGILNAKVNLLDLP